MQISKAYEEISERLKMANLMELSRVSGVALNTLRAVRDGTANPTIATLEAITKALDGEL